MEEYPYTNGVRSSAPYYQSIKNIIEKLKRFKNFSKIFWDDLQPK